MSTNIWVNGDREYEALLLFPVMKLELIHPQLLNISRVDPAVTVRRFLNEHHRRQVVKIPTGRNLHQTCHGTLFQRLHPVVGMLLVIDWVPLVACTQVIALTIVVRETVIVVQAILEHELSAFLGRLPPRSDHTARILSGEGLDQAVALVHDGGLLLDSHGDGIFVAVAVKTDLVACVGDGLTFLGKSLETVARNEPCCFHAVFLEHF